MQWPIRAVYSITREVAQVLGQSITTDRAAFGTVLRLPHPCHMHHRELQLHAGAFVEWTQQVKRASGHSGLEYQAWNDLFAREPRDRELAVSLNT